MHADIKQILKPLGPDGHLKTSIGGRQAPFVLVFGGNFSGIFKIMVAQGTDLPAGKGFAGRAVQQRRNRRF